MNEALLDKIIQDLEFRVVILKKGLMTKEAEELLKNLKRIKDTY